MEIKAVIFLTAVVLASGCAENNPNGTVTPDESISGNGLEITDFKVADKTLTPGQETSVILDLQNYHTKDINITDISLYNLGLLEAESMGCTPEEIDKANEEIKPQMQCKWRLTAPTEEEMGGFEQRPLSFNLHLEYESYLTNTDPLELEFKPLEDVNSTEEVSRTFSNGEVKGSMTVESPATFQGREIQFEVTELDPGRTVSNFTFEYSPDIFKGCPERDQTVIGDSLEFSCTVQDSQEAKRFLSFSTRYKYVKEPTVDVTLEGPR